MESNQNKVIRAGVGYSLGNVLIRGISFLTAPIFTRILTTGDFGLYTTFVSYESILAMIIGLCLHASVKSANIEYPGRLDNYVSSVCSFQILLLVLSVSLWCISSLCNFDPLKIGKIPLLLMIINGFANSVIMVYNAYLGISYEYKKYLILSFISSVGNILFSFVLIYTVFAEQRYLGRIAGTASASLLVACLILVLIFRMEKPELCTEFIRFGVVYSLPIIPHGLAQTLLSQFGKIAVQNISGNEAAGIFGIAFTVAIIPQVLGTSLDNAWSPWFYENYKKNNDLVRKRSVQYLLIFSLIIIALNSVSGEIVSILAPASYRDARYIVPAAVLSMYFLFLYYFPAAIEYYEKKTKYIAFGSVVAAAFNVVLNFVCVRKYGYVASAYVTLATYVVYLALHIRIASVLDDLPFNMKEMGIIVLITSVVSGLDVVFTDQFLIRLLLLAVGVTGLYFSNKEYINEMIWSFWAAIRKYIGQKRKES